jgi:hypothetical protein
LCRIVFHEHTDTNKIILDLSRKRQQKSLRVYIPVMSHETTYFEALYVLSFKHFIMLCVIKGKAEEEKRTEASTNAIDAFL